MLLESEWLGDAIVLPAGITDDREDEMCPGLGDWSCNPTDIRLDQSGAAPDRCDLAKSPRRRRWIVLLTSVVGELRSRLHRRREIRRMNTAWAMVDDRTLKDIGTSRLEVEHGGNARYWG